MSPIKIAVLISGGGTNLQALIDHVAKGEINAQIVLVVANKKSAYGLTRATQSGIESIYIDRNQFENNISYDKKLIKELENREVELVVLAGYMRILSAGFIQAFKNKIINIHPSLIPSFCGKGFYGDKVHKAVLSYGVKLTGATVHFVDEGTDTGPVILQEAVTVSQDDTVETLKEKVLKVEHKILPKAVKLYCENKLRVIENEASRACVMIE